MMAEEKQVYVYLAIPIPAEGIPILFEWVYTPLPEDTEEQVRGFAQKYFDNEYAAMGIDPQPFKLWALSKDEYKSFSSWLISQNK